MDIRYVTDMILWDTVVEKHNGSYSCYSDWLLNDAAFNMLELQLLGMYDDDKLVDIFPLLVDYKRKRANSCGCFVKNNLKEFISFSEITFSLSLITITTRLSGIHLERSVCINYLQMFTDISAFNDISSYLKLHGTVRKNYNKALNNKLSVKDEIDCSNFYTFYRDMVRRNHAGNELPFKWFESLLNKCSNHAGMLTAFQDRSAVGSVLYFTTKNEIFNYFTVIDYAHRHLQAGTLLFFSLYQKAIENKILYVNLGPDTCGSPTFEFKKKFGAIPQPVYTIQYTANHLLRLQFQIENTFRKFVFKHPSIFQIVRRILKK